MLFGTWWVLGVLVFGLDSSEQWFDLGSRMAFVTSHMHYVVSGMWLNVRFMTWTPPLNQRSYYLLQ